MKGYSLSKSFVNQLFLANVIARGGGVAYFLITPAVRGSVPEERDEAHFEEPPAAKT
jgi:hypothetical protein